MPKIMIGLMRISNMNEDELFKFICDCINNDLCDFDIADIYGRTKCETLLGNVIKSHPELRSKITIQSKVGIAFLSKGYDSSYDYIVEKTKECINRLNCGYLDTLLIHRPDVFMDSEEVSSAISYLMDNNLIKEFGVSNFNSSELEYLKTSLSCKIKCNQVQLGLGNTTMIDQIMYTNMPSTKVSKEADDLFFYMKKEHLEIQCWSPYQYGHFEGSIFNKEKHPQINEALEYYANKYNTSPCAIASAFLFMLDKNISIITGSTTISHILETKDGLNVKMTKADWYELYSRCGHILP